MQLSVDATKRLDQLDNKYNSMLQWLDSKYEISSMQFSA